MSKPVEHIHPKADHSNRNGLIGGVAVWFLHFNILYGITSLSCKWGWLDTSIGPLTQLQVVQIILTLAALALLGWLFLLAWRKWRDHQSEQPRENAHMLRDTEQSRRALSSFIVLSINAFFFLAALAVFVPLFALNACAPV